MSYFSRHMDPEDMIPQARVTVWKEKDSKLKFNKKVQFPIISFHEDFDQEAILNRAEKWLDQNEPDWREHQEKYSLEVIPPEEEE